MRDEGEGLKGVAPFDGDVSHWMRMTGKEKVGFEGLVVMFSMSVDAVVVVVGNVLAIQRQRDGYWRYCSN